MDPADRPERLARMQPAMAARATALGVVGGGLVALAIAAAGPLAAASGALVLVLALLLVLRPGDPAGPRHSVVRALPAPRGATPEPTPRTLARALVQAAPGAIVAAELTVLAAPWPALLAAPGAVLLALGTGDARAALAARAGERRTETRVLVRTCWTRGLIPLPAGRRVRPRDVYLERPVRALPAPAPPTRRPPVWLIGPGTTEAERPAAAPPRVR